MEPLAAGDPRWLGGYRLLRRLGSGGMGVVYLGRNPGGRTVAVKAVHARLARDPSFRARFAREVAAARRVGGAWTAPVLDADPGAEVPWVATGYVAGPDLQRTVDAAGPLPPHSVRALGAGTAEALAAVHDLGLVHRDIKPSNVLLTLDGPRLIDFGIARALDVGTDVEGGAITDTGMSIGSPGYMSPEQILGEEVGPATDVFALGAVLALASGGRPPFLADGAAQLLYRMVHGEPDLDAVPGELREPVGRCLAKDPADRPDPADLARELSDGRGAAVLVREGWLPHDVVEGVSRRAVLLLNLEAGTDGAGLRVDAGTAGTTDAVEGVEGVETADPAGGAEVSGTTDADGGTPARTAPSEDVPEAHPGAGDPDTTDTEPGAGALPEPSATPRYPTPSPALPPSSPSSPVSAEPAPTPPYPMPPPPGFGPPVVAPRPTGFFGPPPTGPHPGGPGGPAGHHPGPGPFPHPAPGPPPSGGTGAPGDTPPRRRSPIALAVAATAVLAMGVGGALFLGADGSGEAGGSDGPTAPAASGTPTDPVEPGPDPAGDTGGTGTSPGTDPDPAPGTDPDPGEGGTLPAEWLGTWEGEVTVLGGIPSGSVEIVLEAGGLGDRVGTMTHTPPIGSSVCTDVLTLVSVDEEAGELRFDSELDEEDSGSPGVCATGVFETALDALGTGVAEFRTMHPDASHEGVVRLR